MLEKLLVGYTIFFHIFAFVLESILWTKPIGRKVFRTSITEAESAKLVAFNQGFYNLFLAIALVMGVGLAMSGRADAQILIDYGMASALGAGLVLIFSAPKLFRAAIFQGGPAVVYLALRILA
jgi:putative membrane protein